MGSLRIVIAWVALIALAGVMINGFLMFLSPRVWSRLPWWVRAFAGIPTERYTITGDGDRIRWIGAFYVAILVVRACLLSYGCQDPQMRAMRVYVQHSTAHAK
jgi:cytochrome b